MARVLIIGGCGYTGSYLAHHLIGSGDGHEITTLDIRPGAHFHRDYRSAYACNLYHDFDVVLWMAGIPNVTAAESDPLGTLSTNVLGLITLRERMREDAYLLYASSASIYHNSFFMRDPAWSREDDPICSPNPTTTYDRSKFIFDYIAQGFLPRCLGLRMGTLAGWTTRPEAMRRELLFNAMNLSALEEGVVRVEHPYAWRAILYLPDLLAHVRQLIRLRPEGVLNLASWNYQISALGYAIADIQRASVEVLASDPVPSPYSFRLDTRRARELTGVEPTPLYAACVKFRHEWEAQRNAA